MGADTKTVRIIETEAGRLVGRVDRVQRKVRWALTCPECAHETDLSEAEFTGQSPPRCPCGWSAAVENPHASDGAPRWHDFGATIETLPAQAA